LFSDQLFLLGQLLEVDWKSSDSLHQLQLSLQSRLQMFPVLSQPPLFSFRSVVVDLTSVDLIRLKSLLASISADLNLRIKVLFERFQTTSDSLLRKKQQGRIRNIAEEIPPSLLINREISLYSCLSCGTEIIQREQQQQQQRINNNKPKQKLQLNHHLPSTDRIERKSNQPQTREKPNTEGNISDRDDQPDTAVELDRNDGQVSRRSRRRQRRKGKH